MDTFHTRTATSDCQGAFQIADEIQIQDHIFHSKPFPHDFLRILPQMIFIIIAYKDPVENQHMKKILDKFIIGFFCSDIGDSVVLQFKISGKTRAIQNNHL